MVDQAGRRDTGQHPRVESALPRPGRVGRVDYTTQHAPALQTVSVQTIVGFARWARNASVTYGGKTPLEMAFGRRPPDILDVEIMTNRILEFELLFCDLCRDVIT